MNKVSIDSDNGLSPVQRQTIIWTNTVLLSIGPSRWNFSEIWIKIENFSFMKIQFKMLSRNGGHFVRGWRWVKEKSRFLELGLYSISHMISYCQILWNLEAVWYGFRNFQLFPNLTDALTERPVKFKNDTIISTSYIAASRLHKIWW